MGGGEAATQGGGRYPPPPHMPRGAPAMGLMGGYTLACARALDGARMR